ncbi:MAG TPA: hypothetical protein VHM02_14270 [Thermoanaerobaculia bacterium]|nr:hypothetical protein [Thermoanaerobaculia bacterium]
MPLDALAALELRLGRSGQAPVDLSIRLDRSTARRLPAAALPSHLTRFACGGRRGAWRGVRWLWLEYDLDGAPGAGGGLPLPSAAADLAPEAPDPLASGLFAALAGRRIPASHRRALERALRALPRGARTRYAFSMLSRPGRPERIEIGGLSFDAVRRLVERLAGADAGRAVGELRPLTADAEPHHLALDVGEEVRPRFGVNCSFRRLPRREPRWRTLLDGLVAAGLCRPEERDALSDWTGAETLWSACPRWPDGAGLGDAVARALSHVKLIAVPGRAPEAKAYLMVQLLRSSARSTFGRAGCRDDPARFTLPRSVGAGGPP